MRDSLVEVVVFVVGGKVGSPTTSRWHTMHLDVTCGELHFLCDLIILGNVSSDQNSN